MVGSHLGKMRIRLESCFRGTSGRVRRIGVSVVGRGEGVEDCWNGGRKQGAKSGNYAGKID